MLYYLFMVKARVRMKAYRQAIQQYAKDKVVLEIGTGALAPLARMCAEAGAKKVYAIEANPQAVEIARKGLQRDGLQEKIEILEGFSFDILALPEKTDILVHELIGLGSGEGMVRIIEDIKRRLLDEKTIFIPLSCKVNVAPVTWQIFDYLTNRVFNLIVKRLSRDILLGKKYEENTNLYLVLNFLKKNFLAGPLEYENVIFNNNLLLTEMREPKFCINKDTLFSGFLFWNSITVSEENIINCFHPTCWANRFISFCQEPLKLLSGDSFVLKTFTDLITNARYEFQSYLMRGEEKLELGVRRIDWDGYV